MRLAVPYPVEGGPPMVRHRYVGGRHTGRHEPHRRVRRVPAVAGLAVSVAAVPVAWWVLLTGAGLPPATTPGWHAPAEQPRREQILPPITVYSNTARSPAGHTAPGWPPPTGGPNVPGSGGQGLPGTPDTAGVPADQPSPLSATAPTTPAATTSPVPCPTPAPHGRPPKPSKTPRLPADLPVSPPEMRSQP